MRIIAGTKRSLPLKTMEGKDTRPTTDRIKETLFNMLQTDVPSAYVLDLFAGSGQIGLEAISRGASYAVFVDNNKKAVSIIQENITFTKSEKESRVISMDVIPALRSLEGQYQFQLIFMDPPYNQLIEKEVLEYLSNSSLLREDARIIVEASLNTDFSYLNQLGFHVLKEKKYKTNVHMFLQKKGQIGD